MDLKQDKIMTNKGHNGWTNYATWRVNIEQIDDIDTDYWTDFIEDNRSSKTQEYDLGMHIKDHVEEMISMQVTPLRNNIAESYALSFLNDVNWREIASHVLDTYKENYWCDNCNERLEDRYMSSYCSSKCQKEDELLATHSKG